MTTLIGVIADTHVPGRLRRLPDGIGEAFKGAALILHAGDINSQRVLDELGGIAPVLAVSGNADPPWMRLPTHIVAEVDGCRIGLTHGHAGWRKYAVDKVRQRVVGYDQARYLRYARQAFEDVDVIVTGHTHRAHRVYIDRVLLFNPGSVAPEYYGPGSPMLGLLRIEHGIAQAEFVTLAG